MKDMPSSSAPAFCRSGASDHPESASKQASLEEASGHPKILKIEEVEKRIAKLPKIVKIKKRIAELSPLLHCSTEEIGRLIEVLENNGYEVEDGIDLGFVIYRVIWIKAIGEEE